MKIKFISTILIIILITSNAYSFGPDGHAWVGAIAQFILAENNPAAAQKDRTLLGGIDLYEAANIPDRIKAWDKKPPTDPTSYHLPREYAAIENQLIAFWQANPPQNGENGPNHHVYHYTDIPILDQRYDEKETGASRFDIVHMIPYCIAVLRGKVSDKNSFKITKPVALILLAHYIGDIHQPLHVGADYFDATGQVNPDTNNRRGFGDEGGNTISLKLKDGRIFKMHSFWDGEAVLAALERVRVALQEEHPSIVTKINTELQNDTHHKDLKNSLAIAAQYFADVPPQNWRPSEDVPVEKWAELWANQILPFAAQAHSRLKFSNIQIAPTNLASANAEEIQIPAQPGYREWSGAVTENEIHKGGWQLAYLILKIFK